MGRFRKKKNKNQAKKPERPEYYPEIIKENLNFEKYYKEQKICANDEEFEKLMTNMKVTLPATFRINTSSKPEFKRLLKIVKENIFSDYMNGLKEIGSDESAEGEKTLGKRICNNVPSFQWILKSRSRSSYISIQTKPLGSWR